MNIKNITQERWNELISSGNEDIHRLVAADLFDVLETHQVEINDACNN